MAIFGNKDQLISEVAGLRRETDMLREFLASKEKEASELRSSIRILQDALIAKESPVAYRDMKMAEEMAAQGPVDLEKMKRNAEINEANRLILRDLEGDLFKDADDLINSLSRVAGSPTFNSLHKNDES